MDIYGDAPNIAPSATSYFSMPSSELDPNLFYGMELKSWVRTEILAMLFDYLAMNFSSPNLWMHAWLAGSGVSYQWEASRDPADLDCLLGVDYVRFRQANQEFGGYSDQEIASTLNESFSTDLMPKTRNWEGYELTYYVNPQSDIRDINPYAAYDLTTDSWTVSPEQNPQPPYVRAWEQKVQRDQDMSTEITKRYQSALNELRAASNPAQRVNAERKLNLAADQAIAVYDDIHTGRKAAFSKVGAGYADYNNFRWQAGKRSGTVQALRTIKDQKKSSESLSQLNTYGVELPDASTLIRRTLRK
jgi:hypothetical protein